MSIPEKINHFTIWQNYSLDLKDWRNALSEEYPNATDSELEKLMYQLNDDALADERMNLKINVDATILCIADIGRWNGRFPGYKEVKSGLICDCLHASKDCDCASFYVDAADQDLHAMESHHDATNFLRFRAVRKEVSEEEYEELLDAITSGRATEEMIQTLTKPLGPIIANVYGWDLNKEAA